MGISFDLPEKRKASDDSDSAAPSTKRAQLDPGDILNKVKGFVHLVNCRNGTFCAVLHLCVLIEHLAEGGASSV